MSRDVVQDHLALAQLAELSARLLSTTEALERLATGIRNHVLFAGTVTIGADGWFGLSFGVPCGAVEVTNTSAANTCKVVGDPPGNEPIQGPGVHYVPPKIFRVVNVDSPTITIYGTAGDRVGVQAFTTGGFAGQGAAAA